jgi:hypothetical protein
MTGFRIEDETAQKAFEVLRSGQHAKARAAYEFSEKQLKTVLARRATGSNASSIAARQDEALASVEYAEALEAFRLVAEAYYGARDKREAASACLDAWRTQAADQRAMGRVG